MAVTRCAECGQEVSPLTTRVLEYVRAHAGGTVTPKEIAAHFGVPPVRVAQRLVQLAERGVIARVGYGVYSTDFGLRRQALLDELQKLAPA